MKTPRNAENTQRAPRSVLGIAGLEKAIAKNTPTVPKALAALAGQALGALATKKLGILGARYEFMS